MNHAFSSVAAAVLAVVLLLPTPAVSAAREPETPEQLYNQGLRQMKRGYYEEATLSFEKVRNHFPFNQYSVLAELRVADCLFEKAAYLEAVDAYRQFQRLHPRHAEIDYVVYKTAKAEFKLAPTVPQRDQSHTTRGLKHLGGFEQRFPGSAYTEEVSRLESRSHRRLAAAAIQVGNFYWKQRQWRAAERRYRLATEQFPQAPNIGKARYRQGLCLTKLDRTADARTVMGTLAVADPEGRWGKRALAFLERHPTPAAPAETAPRLETGPGPASQEPAPTVP